MPSHSLEEILHPRSIAVIGATPAGRRGPSFVATLLDLGFKGKIYAVNPSYPEVDGLKCYPSLKEIPEAVDYAICAVPARVVPTIVDDCSQKGIKALHIYTGRFGETGRPEEAELEQEVLRRARKGGIRLIGPNCMGLYCPAQGIGWSDKFSTEPGTVGVASQSSYVVHDFILMAMPRGIRFSKVIGFGNALDLNECDYLDYFAQDSETKIVLMYIEGVKDGKRFLPTLRKAAAIKPVIIIKGGRGKAGTKAAASHTASLAGSMTTWETALAQAGAISAESVEELLDLAVSFHFLPPIRGRRVGIAGSGGGPSVLAADHCEESGLDVIPMPDEIRNELKSKGIPVWDWIGNPVDMTIAGGAFGPGDMLQMMARNQSFDLLIAITGEPHYKRQQQGLTADSFVERYKMTGGDDKPLLVVVPDKSLDVHSYEESTARLFSEIRTQLVAANIPFYPTMGRAAKAAVKLIDYYQRIDQR